MKQYPQQLISSIVQAYRGKSPRLIKITQEPLRNLLNLGEGGADFLYMYLPTI